MRYATNNIKNSQLTALYRIHTYVLYARQYIGIYLVPTFVLIEVVFLRRTTQQDRTQQRMPRSDVGCFVCILLLPLLACSTFQASQYSFCHWLALFITAFLLCCSLVVGWACLELRDQCSRRISKPYRVVHNTTTSLCYHKQEGPHLRWSESLQWQRGFVLFILFFLICQKYLVLCTNRPTQTYLVVTIQ